MLYSLVLIIISFGSHETSSSQIVVSNINNKEVCEAYGKVYTKSFTYNPTDWKHIQASYMCIPVSK